MIHLRLDSSSAVPPVFVLWSCAAVCPTVPTIAWGSIVSCAVPAAVGAVCNGVCKAQARPLPSGPVITCQANGAWSLAGGCEQSECFVDYYIMEALPPVAICIAPGLRCGTKCHQQCAICCEICCVEVCKVLCSSLVREDNPQSLTSQTFPWKSKPYPQHMST